MKNNYYMRVPELRFRVERRIALMMAKVDCLILDSHNDENGELILTHSLDLPPLSPSPFLLLSPPLFFLSIFLPLFG